MTQIEQERYSRHLLLPEIGLEGQQKLKNARVLVIGAGGLGCPVLQYLTAAGIGTIGVADGDTVALSNLQRQILFSTADVGKPKAHAAIARLQEQNPLIQFRAHPDFLTSENALEWIAGYGVVVDGSDNFATRYLVNDACVMLNKPLVFGSIYRFEGQVSVFNVGDGPTYRCLYPDPSDLPACAEAGVLGVLPGITGCLMANEVIKLITSTGELLSGKLLIFNAMQMQFQTFGLVADPANKRITGLSADQPVCAPPVLEITYDEYVERLEQETDLLLIDVREPEEAARRTLGGQLIPLAQVLAQPDLIPANRAVIIYCQSGVRSKKAVEFLQAQGFQEVASLKGGLSAIPV
ncbi:adenylyltransferase/sulfurtransferase [Larkinella arboricola]|uniref:Molybdopterin-synthase adenylyltransferase n=1 Tax=Larkinella arboricola TaxID=643671 RepID=A0A327WKG4_LARAB|nr:molybdopterin-synthase adenylyltransferase MoeB [Larkinella arboricola]RAJ92263.1 adenylyltransferase/sulfurtransferase [Larkinella arboricola]